MSRAPARLWLLLAALAATVAAAGWVGGGQSPAPVPEPRERPATQGAPPPRVPLAALDLERLQGRAAGGRIGELFAPRDWQLRAHRRKASPAAPPAPERAPPLPFVFLGRMIEKGEVTVFLSVHGSSVVAREGDVIDGRYRVDEIGAVAMRLTYLPLDEAQSLALGRAP